MKKTAKILVLCLCAALTVSQMETTAFALSSAEEETDPQTESETLSPAGDAALSKDETVYVLAGTDGSVQKIIVSDWLRNSSGSATLNDQSELTDIENVKGDETFTTSDDQTLVWDAQGQDIYYQGNIEKELPADISITYEMDGTPGTAEELTGKSGRVTIRFDYQNRQCETVDINGKEETIYVPFTMLTGVVLDNDTFTNIEVSNGRAISDGSRTAIVGIAFPGLQEDLGIDREQLEIPDHVEITADTSNFKPVMTVTLGTNELFNELDVDSFDSVSQLNESMNELTDAMSQLLDGSSQLYDGLSTLLEKSEALTDGAEQLAAGAESLNSGASSLNTGADALQSGAAQLSQGLQTLTSNNDALNSGAKQVFDTLLSTANTQLAAAGLDVPAMTIENYGETLDSIITALDDTGVYAQTVAQVTQAVQDAIAQKSEEQTQSDDAEQANMAQMELQVQMIVSEKMASEEVQAQLAAAAEGAKPVIALKSSLDSYNAFYLGLESYTAGVADAATGAETLKGGTDDLKAGTSQLSDGTSELYQGILTLKDGTPALIDGITQLRDGSQQLSDGLKEFNEQGIQKLTDAVEGDLNRLADRFRATRDVSLRYKNFSGAGEDMDGQVKFIYRTDADE